jgi:hypothetical protein
MWCHVACQILLIFWRREEVRKKRKGEKMKGVNRRIKEGVRKREEEHE